MRESVRLAVFAVVLCPLLAGAVTLHVWTNSPGPSLPYGAWTNAAHTIQDAVDAAMDGDTVLVTNGFYNTGGVAAPGSVLTNRVYVTNSIAIRSVNGPSQTFIVGASDIINIEGTNHPFGRASARGVFLGGDSILDGFTVTNGHGTVLWVDPFLDMHGAGVYVDGRSTVIDCVISGNVAPFEGGGVYGWWSTLTDCQIIGNGAHYMGGGVSGGALVDCLVAGNWSLEYAGGVENASLTNCVIAGNTAAYVGAADLSDLVNCTVVGNCSTASNERVLGALNSCDLYSCVIAQNSVPPGEDDSYVRMWNCCSSNEPASGSTNNITLPPRFVDYDGGDYRLRYDSPCVDAGTNMSPAVTNDYEGLTRPLDGDFNGVATVDMGAHEYDPNQDADGDAMLDGWEYRHGLDPTNATDAARDDDGDGLSNVGEHTADTDPTNSLSVFSITAVSNQPERAFYFPSSSNREYSLLSRLSVSAGEWACVTGQTNIPGSGGIDALIDSNATASATYCLRVGFPVSEGAD